MLAAFRSNSSVNMSLSALDFILNIGHVEEAVNLLLRYFDKCACNFTLQNHYHSQ